MTTVFFVDDEESILRSFRRLLQKQGERYRFEFFPGGRAALGSPLVPDVLITDARMPELSGCELIARLKTRHPRLVAVMLTGEPEDSGCGEPLVDFFLEKPCDVQELLSILANLPESAE